MAHEPNAFHHVQDANEFHIFDSMGKVLFDSPIHIHLPKILGFQITKFMVLELFAAILILLIFIPLARRAQHGSLPTGRWWNAFEALLTFVRDKIARPTIGDHDADKYVPFLWTTFLFILFCNLMGMIPFLGSPTASIWVTGALAVCSFVMMHGAPIKKMGLGHYLKSLWPHVDAPYIGPIIAGMIFFIEVMGTFIKAFVLAVRLFANMFAGHLVLSFILLFIYMAGKDGFWALWPVITIGSVLGQVALSLLELFVAFLQAYVFTYLTALFVGMGLHPAH